jgi:hypothetical protein
MKEHALLYNLRYGSMNDPVGSILRLQVGMYPLTGTSPSHWHQTFCLGHQTLTPWKVSEPTRLHTNYDGH